MRTLFIDDEEIARQQNVRRGIHPGRKRPEGPVLAAEAPWEEALICGGTVRREADVCQMWYQSYGHHTYINLYATSRDGIVWERPVLGQYPDFEGRLDNNIFLSRLGLRSDHRAPVNVNQDHNPNVLYTPHQGEERTYTLFSYDYGRSGYSDYDGYFLAYSRDGIVWTDGPKDLVIPAHADVGFFTYDERDGKFRAIVKSFLNIRRRARRSVLATESRDGLDWTLPRPAVIPDLDDDAQAQCLTENAHTQFYGMPIFRYESLLLGFLQVFRVTDTMKPDHDGPVDVQLVCSRDGHSWRRVGDRRAIVELGAPGTWDAGGVYSGNSLVCDGDEVRLYYTGASTTHGVAGQMAIGMVSWRQDRFVGLSIYSYGRKQDGANEKEAIMHDVDVLSLMCKTAPWVVKGLVMLAVCNVIALASTEEQMAWRPEDVSRIDTPADDRPNEESRKIVTQYYTPILKDLFVLGDNKKIGFRLFPRNERWIGLLLTTPEGKPIEAPKRGVGQYRIELVNPDAKPSETPEKSEFVHYHNAALFSDASRYFRPRTEIKVCQSTSLLDRAVMDFRSLVFQDSKVQMSAFNEGPTQKSGFIRPKDSDLIREDGKRMFLWGGHENHIPSKATSDAYAEVYREAGLNVFRFMGTEEMIKDPATGAIDPEKLDQFHYLVFKLGQQGIYFMLSYCSFYVPGGLIGYPADRPDKELDWFRYWTDPKVRNTCKTFWKEVLTRVNPYTGKALKDNPTLLGFEWGCESALNGRYFDYNRLDEKGKPESEAWRKRFNEYLLKKYGPLDNGKLKDAWSMEQVFKWEDPAKNTIPIPWRFRGDRGYGDWGEVIGTYYLDGTARRASPRLSDVLEFQYEIQKEWATDLFTFIRDEVGLKVGVGWTDANWHICQIPAHKANMDSPASLYFQANYCDWDCGAQLTSRLKNIKHLAGGYSYIYHRPTFAYEWGGWTTMGPYQYEWILLAALFGRVYGFDGFAHHKMSPIVYPVADPYYSLKVNTITPISDRPRRGAFYVCRWILERSKIEEIRDKILIGYPKQSAFTAGATRHFANPVFENWLMFQIGTEDYSFDEVYDGPTDRIVIHEGHGPYGDYRNAQHAILWSHANTGRDGKDLEAKTKWFAQHGIIFKPGQKYYVDDHYFATTEDMSDYLAVHEKAEHARQEALKQGQKVDPQTKQTVIDVRDNYWAAEPEAQPTELDRQLYEALKRWGYPLPFAVEDIDKVWRHRQKNMVLDSAKVHFAADRDDIQLWFGKGGKNTRVCLSKLTAETDEHQYAVALLPWDTAEFSSSKTLVVWCMWNSRITVTLPFPGKPKIYAVNWLGKRLFEVTPLEIDRDHVTFLSARHDDIFCYEIAR